MSEEINTILDALVDDFRDSIDALLDILYEQEEKDNDSIRYYEKIWNKWFK